MKLLVDKITIKPSGTGVDIIQNVKGTITIDKEKVDELISGLMHVSGEQIEINLETVDITGAEYNALHALINQNVTVTFFNGAVSKVVALNVRIYPKLDGTSGDYLKVTITGGKKFATADTLSDHVTFA